MDTMKKELYQLIDKLPERDFFTAKKFLRFLLSDYSKNAGEEFISILENAPLDDEPLTEEEILAIEEGEKALSEGKVHDWEDVKRELGI